VKQLAAAAIVLALLGAPGCTAYSGRLNIYETKNPEHRPSVLGVPLRNGQVVLTEAPGDLSFVFELIPQHFYPFTHAAIVSVEDGIPWVYEVTGDYSPHFHRKVLDNVHGGVRRRPFPLYVAPNLYAEVFDPPPGVDGDKVAAFVRQKYAEGVEFDAYFRYDEHEKLFCTEFVELALEAGGAKPRPLDPVRDNPSLKTAMRWLGVPLDTALPAGVYQDESRFVAAMGHFQSRAGAYAYFEGKREVHRRFTKDQRLGYLFELHATGDLTARPELVSFMIAASRATQKMDPPPEPNDPRIREAVRRIADEMFGPVTGAD
jgi:hypothetical protein